MKKIWFCVFLVCITLQLCSCASVGKEKDAIEYDSGSYHNKNWDDAVGTYDGDVVCDEESAIDIAKAVYRSIEKNGESNNYVPQSVFYDVADGVWVVSFGKDGVDNEVGGGCSIALQKKDGKVLRIWYGE